MNSRINRATTALPIFVLIALLLGACASPSTTETPTDVGSLEVGSMVWDTSNPFYSNFIKGQRDAAAEFGVNLDLQNGQAELGTEVAVIRQFITQGKDLIIVTPSDIEGIVPVIQEANQAGIPVIAANNRIGEGAEVVTYVGADDYEFGLKQGEMLVNAVGEEATVGLILGALGTSPQILREEGLTDYLQDYPGVQIVEKQTANWSEAEALALSQDWLSKYGTGQLTAIIDQGSGAVTGAQWAAENGRTDVQFLVGDFPADVKQAISDGLVYGTVNQDPYPQGKTAVEYAYYWLSDQRDNVEQPNHHLPLPIVTKENVDEYPAAWGDDG